MLTFSSISRRVIVAIAATGALASAALPAASAEARTGKKPVNYLHHLRRQADHAAPVVGGAVDGGLSDQ